MRCDETKGITNKKSEKGEFKKRRKQFKKKWGLDNEKKNKQRKKQKRNSLFTLFRKETASLD